jgi:hypothetical protein
LRVDKFEIGFSWILQIAKTCSLLLVAPLPLRILHLSHFLQLATPQQTTNITIDIHFIQSKHTLSRYILNTQSVTEQ